MAQNDTHVALIILTTQMWGGGGGLLVEKTFSGQNLCSCAFGANIRSYTKQRARHGTPFLQPPPPLLRRASMSPPPPSAEQFSGRPVADGPVAPQVHATRLHRTAAGALWTPVGPASPHPPPPGPRSLAPQTPTRHSSRAAVPRTAPAAPLCPALASAASVRRSPRGPRAGTSPRAPLCCCEALGTCSGSGAAEQRGTLGPSECRRGSG